MCFTVYFFAIALVMVFVCTIIIMATAFRTRTVFSALKEVPNENHNPANDEPYTTLEPVRMCDNSVDVYGIYDVETPPGSIALLLHLTLAWIIFFFIHGSGCGCCCTPKENSHNCLCCSARCYCFLCPESSGDNDWLDDPDPQDDCCTYRCCCPCCLDEPLVTNRAYAPDAEQDCKKKDDGGVVLLIPGGANSASDYHLLNN